ncbi:hypothetical protein M8Z33_36010 [Streptomyces sp. ZAF1911]|uniref:hypothetical protein n=1 Tax=Streptomyces TaxID=1883 RepID=UPI00202E4AA2|nr:MULTISPECIES: hypothetical protein [unclassified Streptomyces]MCM1968659.1 hypothetical protein [Streptomyces sp. G1]MCP3756720.1 hypothetical protein [Streptomyces sp. TBY4]MCX5125012.1 hypothetical protein [Streptomyces sp. NBC_00347]MDD9381962.1 hypothetical protein [Streptomyces sp. ZAF1911]
MFPSISLAQEIGIAVLLVAAVVWLIGLGHMLWDSRFHHPEPGAFEGLSVIPAQRGTSVHPMESVELTEAEQQAFAGLVRTIPLH